MKKIDLSFLRHKELPIKDVKVVLNGEEVEVSIKPISGKGLTDVSLISEDDLNHSSKLCLIALMYGLGIKQDIAEQFMNQEVLAADTLAAEIFQFTSEYQSELELAKKEVKKNSKKGQK